MKSLGITIRGSVLLLLSIAFIFALFYGENVRAQAIEINANFDSGSIESYTINGNEVDITLNTDNVGYKYWANFLMSNILNQEVTVSITNIDEVPFLADPSGENQIIYSCDGINWNRLTPHSYSSDSGGTYTFTKTFPCDEAQIATFFPFSSENMSSYADMVNSSQWADKTILGSSYQGRDIDLLTITNTAIPVSNKKIIYIVGRQHSAETSSSHMLEGMIDFLISDNVDASGLRDNYIWYIVPMVNPDGVYLGKSRENSEGNDPNRDWGNNDTVEIDTVRDLLDLINYTDGIDMFIDWHSQMNDDGWYNFVYAPPGNTFFNILSDWTDFDVQKTPGTSCSYSSCSARGYGTQEGIFTLVFEPTPHLVSWTQDSLNEQGENTAYAINEYFGMFEAPLLVDSDFAYSADSADLRANSPGRDWYESRGEIPTLLTLNTDDIGGNSTKKAEFSASSSDNSYVSQKLGSPQSGAFTVEWEIYVDSILDISAPDRAGWMLIGDDSSSGNGPNADDSERFVYMAFFKDGGGTTGTMDLVARDQDDNWTQFTTVATGLNLKQWYTIKVVCDVETDSYDIYVDDDYKATVTSRNEKTSLTHISFAQWDDGAGTFYVDNVGISGPEPEWTELTYDDFESGWGNYSDGGRDCKRYTDGTHAHQGSSAINIQDNSGVSSSFYYTNGVDVVGYTQIKVEFWFKAVSMESGEDFWVQYYDGSTWQTVASYARSTDFDNNVFYNETVYIDEGAYTFPANMKIRFMNDASGNRDDVYIDEIRVSAK